MKFLKVIISCVNQFPSYHSRILKPYQKIQSSIGCLETISCGLMHTERMLRVLTKRKAYFHSIQSVSCVNVAIQSLVKDKMLPLLNGVLNVSRMAL